MDGWMDGWMNLSAEGSVNCVNDHCVAARKQKRL